MKKNNNKYDDKCIIFGKNSKFINKEIFSPNNFIESRFSQKRINSTNEFKKFLENSHVEEKNFLELFQYKDFSCWWLFSQETFFLKCGEIISFIDNFSDFLEINNYKKIIILDYFDWKNIITDLGKEHNLIIYYPKISYYKFLIFKKIKKIAHSYKIKKIKLSRIKQIKNCFSMSKNISIQLDNQIIFVSPITYRRKFFNFLTKKTENREYLVDDIIEISNIKAKGISVDFSLTPKIDRVLSERLESTIPWIPEEIFLSNYDSSKNFIKNYNFLIQQKKFTDLFLYKNISIWNSIKEIFLEMKNYPYLPYWIALYDSLEIAYKKNRPKIIFLTAEINPNTLIHLSVANKLKIPSVRIQQAMISSDNQEFIHRNFFSKSNLLGYPTPQHYLVFGDVAKKILVEHGFSEEKIIKFGNPIYSNLSEIKNIDYFTIRKKIGVRNKSLRIILFTSTKWQSNVMDEDLDPKIWNELLKFCKNNINYMVILKPHPGEDIKIYEYIAKNFPTNCYKIFTENLIEPLLISDIVVSNFSSVIIDAVCFEKPIFEIVWENHSSQHFFNYEISIPTKIKELNDKIQDFFNNPQKYDYLKRNQNEFLNQQYGFPISKLIMKEIILNLIR